ncbi:glycosyltransferase [Pseudobutyrivibrio sp.]|uniref:glycosyltransferase n=1 Tax=Pseudobutyrivibrio sp. TaxID=2014367 RepID=UPI0025FDF7D3|nr:glycosyltransferase [Pseudobutyrivibrio sp.]
MESEKRVSVIVPVFNNKEYLFCCVNSLLEQTYKNIEIILVDDGSSDGSGQLCDEFKNNYSNIRVIHQKNGGQQAARRAGVLESTGEYISFVDADDWVSQDMYTSLINIIEDSDLITSGIYHFINEKDYEIWTDNIEEGEYYCDDDSFLEGFIIKKGEKTGAPQIGSIMNNLVCKIFKKEIIYLLMDKFDFGIKDEEDYLFLMHYVLLSEKIRVTHKIFYNYRKVEGSVTQNVNNHYLRDRDIYYNAGMKILIEHKVGEKVIEAFQKRFLYSIYLATPNRLGLGDGLNFPKYVLPHKERRLIAGKKIIIFGAGVVGKSYIETLEQFENVEIVGCIDSGDRSGFHIKGYRIKNIEELDVEYDYVVCASLNKTIRLQMKRKLLDKGVDAKKIISIEPINIFNDYYLR